MSSEMSALILPRGANGGEDHEVSTTSSNYFPDWMGELGPKLASAKVGEVVWPGTHDSGAFCKEFDFTKVVNNHWQQYIGTHVLNCLGHGPKNFASGWSKTQSLSIQEQLEHGIRYIDLRISKCLGDSCYYIVHSFCGPSLNDILEEIVGFFSKHENECLLLQVDPVTEVDHIELHSIFERNLGNFLLKRQPGPGQHFSPISLTISHLIEKGRIIILYNFPTLYGYMDDVLCFWDSRCIYAPFITSLDPTTKEDFQLKKFTAFPSKDECNFIFHFMYALTPTFSGILKSYLGYAGPNSLQDCAHIFNPKLPEFIKRIKCHIESEQCYDIGMIISNDFVDESDLMLQVLSMNKSKFRNSLVVS